MWRYILWLMIIYFGWRILRTMFSLSQRPKNRKDSAPTFHNVEDADFEDITHKEDSSEPTQPKQDT